ncbi:hypothetical protein [Massilia sp.]|uniref:hypothetical protein n=1 Tax=Massilia sp. TaxID=1882437 RepID=UPI00289E5EA5|nr:hypothetical protein [Massilia sp.]
MQRYSNRSGESGIVAYEIGKDPKEPAIIVEFLGGDRYLYTGHSAGVENIARMQELAHEGQGLSTFISRHVRERYARKLT